MAKSEIKEFGDVRRGCVDSLFNLANDLFREIPESEPGRNPQRTSRSAEGMVRIWEHHLGRTSLYREFAWYSQNNNRNFRSGSTPEHYQQTLVGTEKVMASDIWW